VETWPRTNGTAHVQLGLRAISSRTVEIRQGDALLWRGTIGGARQSIEFDGMRLDPAGIQLTLSSPDAPVKEGPDSGARALSFAVYNVRVE
jgi:hypothetical protein